MQTFYMMVDDIFVLGNKLIFSGKFEQQNDNEIKGLADLIVNGLPLWKIHIEGEVFDNTPQPSVWAIKPENLELSQLKGKEVVLKIE